MQLLWRQKMIVIPLSLVSLAACIAVVVAYPPTYRATSAVVLLNPPELPEVSAENPTIPDEYQNPYSRFGDLSVIVDILVRVLESDAKVEQLEAQGLDGTYQVAANRDFYRGPIVDIAAEASSEEDAIAAANLAMDALAEELDTLQRQQGTDPSYFITVETVVAADKATTVFSGTLRALIVVAMLGMVLTIGTALFADARRARRERKFDDGVDGVVDQLKTS